MSVNTVKVAGRELALSNLEKDLYPSYGFTKARVLEYYGRIAPVLLPHLRDRALTLKRYPDGADAEYFFEKRCPAGRPAWLKTAEIPYGSKKKLTACLVNDLQTLLWVENLASLELHVPLARAATPGKPDSVVFDLDPGDGAGLRDCVKVALMLKGLFDGMKLFSCVKTSGKKGLHVFVPLNTAADFGKTKAFSKAVAGVLQKSYPALVTAQMAKELRKGRVFINWSQNDAAKTMVAVYSLRAGPVPTVSFPLAWKELQGLNGPAAPAELQVTPAEAVARAQGDLFRDLLVKKQELPYL
ncbi:MAG: ATP-dependent DNA ligase [Elusimicrobia bacterium GWC2_64_44]|nr:MAG: ATP-dependent DNA ligase [Elusimicrobia bacterium GWC2_64_44]